MNVLVVAPHPDDELLGCGGTLLRYASEGVTLGWLIVTGMNESYGWDVKRINERAIEIQKVQRALGIQAENLYQLDLPPAGLDSLPLSDVIGKISEVFSDFQPDEVFLPHPGDVHSDHRVCFEAAMACTKWFRYPSVKRVLTYETVSETDANLDVTKSFQPSVFFEITDTLDRKWELLQLYKSEMKDFPFPRSEKTIRSLAHLRGSQAGYEAAEAFCLLRERNGHGDAK
jgi:LmbE family N-acetylglucosaminyl deacetylase